jgi:hypothetical protein
LADRLFHVEWSAGAAEPDRSRIVGYVYNDYREDAVNVQLQDDDAILWGLWAPWE